MQALHVRMIEGVFRVAVVVGWLCAVTGVAGMGPPGDSAGAVRWEGDTAVYEAEGWALRIEYLQKGTRSEGQDGTLRHDGEPVEPSEPGEVLDTPLGQLKHYGKERKMAWDITGWNFADRRRALPSSRIGEGAKGAGRAAGDGRVTVPIPEKGGEVSAGLRMGQTLALIVRGNPSTGYRWDLVEDSVPGIVRAKGSEDFQSDRPLLGSPGQQVLLFEAVKAGQTRVRLAYHRPWEKGQPPEYTATVNISVIEE